MKWKIIGDLLEIVVGMANFRKFAIYPPQKHTWSRIYQGECRNFIGTDLAEIKLKFGHTWVMVTKNGKENKSDTSKAYMMEVYPTQTWTLDVKGGKNLPD